MSIRRNAFIIALQQICAIARTTFLESIQQPIAFLLSLSSVVLTLCVPIFQFHRFGEDGRLARDSGLSCLLIFGMALAVTTAGRSVAGELSGGTAASVLGKPVGRPLFIFSKWIGCAALTGVYALGQLAATLLAERASAHFLVRENFNGYASDPVSLTLAFGALVATLLIAALLHYFFRFRFGVSVFWGILIAVVLVTLLSAFHNRLGGWYTLYGEAECGINGCRHDHSLHPIADPIGMNFRVIPAAVLIFFCLTVFAALATALSTRLQPGAVFAFCAGVLLAGLSADTFFQNTSLFSLQGFLAGVLPDLQQFWMCDAIARGGRIAPRYLLHAAGYASTLCILFLSAGCLAFEHRDVG